LYWTSVNDEREAHYLVGILNSEAARKRIEGLQSEGQFGARDFDKVMFSLPIPRFQASNRLHLQLARTAMEAEQRVQEMEMKSSWSFQRIRRSVREALNESGLNERIDAFVEALLRSSSSRLAS